MQILKHDPDGPHKLIRIETTGCAVNILVDLHEGNGTSIVAVEVEPSSPDEFGRIWKSQGPTTIVVRCLGRQGEELALERDDVEMPLATIHHLVSSSSEPIEAINA